MNKIILAPAGGRKTQSIIDECSSGEISTKRLLVTFTTTGQKVLEKRIWKSKQTTRNIEITGWYSFLLNHIVKPYINDKYPDHPVKGLHFVDGEDPTIYRRGSKRYFDDDYRAYSNRIGKLAYDVAVSSNGAWINRLENIFDEIYIDEVQDLVGNDLDILEALFKSSIRVLVVGDVRQSLYATSKSDSKHRKYQGLQKINWFRDQHSNGLCMLEERFHTWRCNQDIIDFADSVLPQSLELPRTESLVEKTTEHEGVFTVSWKNLPDYIQKYNPQCYRDSIITKILEEVGAINFGQCKGETVPRVLIYPTKPIKNFLKNPKKTLTDSSASSFYVAITRAIHSVAIVVENPALYSILEWTADGYMSPLF